MNRQERIDLPGGEALDPGGGARETAYAASDTARLRAISGARLKRGRGLATRRRRGKRVFLRKLPYEE